MKRFCLLIVAMFMVSMSYAQSPERALMEAKIAYDEAVMAYKHSLADARNEERRVEESAERRIAESKADLAAKRKYYKTVVAEQKQRVAMAKRELKNATLRHKEEAMRAKQEVTAAKANTESVIAERKSEVARAKAEIARVKAERR